MQAQQLALQRNADLQVAEAQVAMAVGQLRAAREFPNPVLNLSTAKIASDGTGNGTPAGNRLFDRSYDSIVALNQLLELGKRGPRADSARAAERTAEAQRDDVRRLLLQSVSQAYIAALEAREESVVLARSAASLRREADLAGQRHTAGDLAASDQSQIEIAAGRLELDAAAARQAVTTTVIILEALLGEPAPRGRLQLADALENLPPLALDDDTMQGERPDIVAAEAGMAKADADLVAQKRAVVPDLTVSAEYERNPPDLPNSVGFGVSLPLPVWNRNAGSIRAARGAQAQARAQLDKARLQAAADISTNRAAHEEARARAAAYIQRLRPASAAVVQTVTYAYEHGGTSLLELLAAERADNEIRVATAHALADAAATSFALAASLNRLPFPPAGATAAPADHIP